ncbi:alkaline phosphatase D family protein [Aliamphritea hakodatensis]|uniref:alkaline phosphatase D family protein n=1 Tax=Aliamphritea hakodatensis TaxID=2895352 RepID=UPI0022FD9289|nr:alkaline phosphatase D family protein [Aliamphritea hakodatensis]
MYFPRNPANVEQDHPKLGSLAIIGHMTAKTCRLWVRMYCAAKWWLVVTESPLQGDLDTLDGLNVDAFVAQQAANPVFCQAKNIGTATDNTVVFNVTGLQAGRKYYYAVIADLADAERIPRRTEIGHQGKKFFHALPANLNNLTFGYFSCHDPFSSVSHSEGAWPLYYQTMVNRNGLFSIGGGDQVYIDTNDKEDMYSAWDWLGDYKNAIIQAFSENGELKKPELISYFAEVYRTYYRLYWNFPNLKKTFQRFPTYMIWDDHEIMDGWGSYTRQERSKLLNRFFQDDDEATNDQLIQLMFEAAKQVYFEYQHSHNPKTPVSLKPEDNEDCQWDYSFRMGDHGFYVLDMRGHHDYERHEDGTALLGAKQMQRVLEWLDDASQRCKSLFIVSPVPVVHWGVLVSMMDIGSVKDDLRDEWEHDTNHKERNILLDAMLKCSHDQGCPVTVLSGDVHSASVYQLENRDKFPNAKVFNATSSAISRKPAPAKAEMLIRSTGNINGYEGGYATRLYALSGQHNFLMVNTNLEDGTASVSVDLYWPAGDDGELTQKRIKLTGE